MKQRTYVAPRTDKAPSSDLRAKGGRSLPSLPPR
ncbi:hypothetical protein J2Z66_008398 [Paenibacillus eucommiae]|uniref:RiPP n=1 Tax=Paenibacillus eucommiae TaxID=1355755 RepID=A0ABS4JAD0_9BACL|nr:hypothetical protein [Paenibacillus eucommiae]